MALTRPQGAAKAWVNFNGTGTIAIRHSFNVSSLTDNGVGGYDINFTNALSDADYAVSGSADGFGVANIFGFQSGNARGNSTTACTVATHNSSNALADPDTVSVACFASN